MITNFSFFSVPEDQQMMFLPEIAEEVDPDQIKSCRRLSTCSNKSDGIYNSNKDKYNDSPGIMQ